MSKYRLTITTLSGFPIAEDFPTLADAVDAIGRAWSDHYTKLPFVLAVDLTALPTLPMCCICGRDGQGANICEDCDRDAWTVVEDEVATP